MKLPRLIIWGGFVALSIGCSGFENVPHPIVRDYFQFGPHWQEHQKWKRVRAEANDVYAQSAPCPSPGAAPDYAQGFKDGFADQTYYGGPGCAPPVPPRYYWKDQYRTPCGYQAIQQWYAGFRDGAYAAQVQGMRNFARIPGPGTPPYLASLPHSGDYPPTNHYSAPLEQQEMMPQVAPEQAAPAAQPQPEVSSEPMPPTPEASEIPQAAPAPASQPTAEVPAAKEPVLRVPMDKPKAPAAKPEIENFEDAPKANSSSSAHPTTPAIVPQLTRLPDTSIESTVAAPQPSAVSEPQAEVATPPAPVDNRATAKQGPTLRIRTEPSRVEPTVEKIFGTPPVATPAAPVTPPTASQPKSKPSTPAPAVEPPAPVATNPPAPQPNREAKRTATRQRRMNETALSTLLRPLGKTAELLGIEEQAPRQATPSRMPVATVNRPVEVASRVVPVTIPATPESLAPQASVPRYSPRPLK